MRPRKRDSSFLVMAAIAATGGMLAVVLSIGFPVWAHFHGRPVTPAFSLFAGWGVAALGGAYACLRTYFISDTPSNPPRGGVRLELITNTGPVAPGRDDCSLTDRAAA